MVSVPSRGLSILIPKKVLSNGQWLRVSVPSRGLSILIIVIFFVQIKVGVSVPSRGLSILIILRFAILRKQENSFPSPLGDYLF